MSEPSPESVPSNIIWDVIRYAVVAVVAGALIWYYFFYTPINYVSREHIGKTMGTDYVVKVAHFPENADWQKIADAVQDRLDALDLMMSTYRSDSEVCQFNAFSSTDDWFPVSQETAQVVQSSLEISQLSGGAFDITVSPLVRHWGFGAGGTPRQSQSFEELKTGASLLKEQVGYEKLFVRLDPPALKKAIPELAIDLSAIAKGFAVDSVAALLDEQKFSDYLIEVGGEVRSKGKKSKRNRAGTSKEKDWIVGIEKPVLESSGEFQGIHQAVPLKDQSLATSGNSLQTRLIGNHRVSHIIDPRTCTPVQFESAAGELASVSVIAPTCTFADAWATALFVLGEQKGLELANHRDLAVLFLLRSQSKIVEVPSKDWSKSGK